MDEKTWLDYAAAFGSIATPILVLILSAAGWKLRAANDRRLELENMLREDRIRTYNIILEPFIILLMTDAAWGMDKKHKNVDKTMHATSKMVSLEYREASFKLALVAPDRLVKSYNNLVQSFYNSGEDKRDDVVKIKAMLELLGKFLIEIRKSMGNETTNLNHWDMCEFWMTDARKLKDGTLKLE